MKLNFNREEFKIQYAGGKEPVYTDEEMKEMLEGMYEYYDQLDVENSKSKSRTNTSDIPKNR